MKAGDVVVYESTMYPDATEEVCVLVLERVSGLKFNQDFFCGYSAERTKPDDKHHRLLSIKRVTSGSTPELVIAVDALYQKIITAGTRKASSLNLPEGAKVIENIQPKPQIHLPTNLRPFVADLVSICSAYSKPSALSGTFRCFVPTWWANIFAG